MPLHAQTEDTTGWVEGDHFKAHLSQSLGDGNTAARLEIEMEEGWHTYGADPGDSGLPPRFEWGESSNLQGVEITWPETIEKTEFDMFTVNAYEGVVRFPLMIKPKIENETVLLNLDLQLMVCNEICIPSGVELKAELTPITL